MSTSATFLRESGLELSDLLQAGQAPGPCYDAAAGLPTRPGGEHEKSLLRRVRAFAHVDDHDRAHTYRQLLADDAPSYNDLSSGEQQCRQDVVLLAVADRRAAHQHPMPDWTQLRTEHGVAR